MLSRTKRVISICTVCMLLLAAFAGCSGKATEQSGTTAGTKAAETKESEAKAEENLPPVTIEWLAYQSVAQPDMESEIVKKVQERFNAKFNIWFIDDQKWDDVLNVKLAAGEMPDIFRLKNRANLRKYATQEIVGEVSVDKIAQEAPNYKKMVDQHNPEQTIWRLTNFEGKNYGFTGVGAGQYPAVIGWRLDWLNNVGITKVPETIAEFEDAFYKFTNNDPDKNEKKDTYGLSNTIMSAILGAFGPPAFTAGEFKGSPLPNLAWTLNDEGTPVINAIQPEMKEGLSLLQKWYKDGVVDPEFLTGENKGGYWALSHDFMNGRIGISGLAAYYHWAPPLNEKDPGGTIYQEWKKIKPEIEFDKTYTLGKAPVGPKGKSGQLAGENFSESMVFSSKCASDDRKVKTILKMLDTFVTDPDYYMFVSYGQKDVNYTLNPDGTYVEMVKSTEEAFKMGRSVFNFMSLVPERSKKLKGPLFDFGDKYLVNAYTMVSVPTTDAYAKSYASLQKLTAETYFNIITGEQSVDSFDEFVKTFMGNGGEEIIQQTQEEWRKITAK